MLEKLFKRKPVIWHDKSVLSLDEIETRMEHACKFATSKSHLGDEDLKRNLDQLHEVSDPTGHRFSILEYNLLGTDVNSKLKKNPDLTIIHAGVVRYGGSAPDQGLAIAVCMRALAIAMSTDRDGWDHTKFDAYNGILIFDTDALFNKYLRIETEMWEYDKKRHPEVNG